MRQTLPMPYDIELADRIRAVLRAEPDLTERRMFGGLAFMVHGNMAVCAGSQGDLMVRIAPGSADALTGEPHVTRMEMRGRQLDGWLLVQREGSSADADLRRWVQHGLTYARGLPPK